MYFSLKINLKFWYLAHLKEKWNNSEHFEEHLKILTENIFKNSWFVNTIQIKRNDHEDDDLLQEQNLIA